jgi:DNA-binding NtrC family response regulator
LESLTRLAEVSGLYHLQIALESGKTVANAARILGITRQSLEAKLKKHPELEIYARRGKPRGINACA